MSFNAIAGTVRLTYHANWKPYIIKFKDWRIYRAVIIIKTIKESFRTSSINMILRGNIIGINTVGKIGATRYES